MVGGCQAQNGRFCFFGGEGGFWGWILGGFWGCGLGGMEEIKNSGGGDVRAFALAWDDEWDKA